MTQEPSFPWADELDCAVTVCDTDGIVLYQNIRSLTVNSNVLGQSLIPCHNDRSRAIIAELLARGGNNVYTIDKRDVRKMIYQTVWRVDSKVCGLVEFSMEIPTEIPNYARS